jgi:hypothetical protein
MTEDQIYQLVVQGGIGAAALGILGKIALKVADRMIGAIDALSKEARDTGKATVDALGLLTQRLARLEGKVEHGPVLRAGLRDGLEYTDAIWVYWTTNLARWDPAHKAVVLDSRNCKWSPHIIGLPSVLPVGRRLAIFYDGNAAERMPTGVKKQYPGHWEINTQPGHAGSRRVTPGHAISCKYLAGARQ